MAPAQPPPTLPSAVIPAARHMGDTNAEPEAAARESTLRAPSPPPPQQLPPAANSLSQTSTGTGRNEGSNPQPVPTRPRPGWRERIGKIAVVLSILALLGEVGATIMLNCVWFLNSRNPTWHFLARRNYIGTLVTILAEVLKQAMMYQLAIAAAMLAAVRLEGGEVPLGKAASVSLARASPGASIYKDGKRIKTQIKGKARDGVGTSLSLFRLLMSSAVVAFTTAVAVLLINDLGLGTIPGASSPQKIMYGYSYNPLNWTDPIPQSVSSDGFVQRSTWGRRPPFYPSFAEYSEEPIQGEFFSDTGVTLRAFLPFGDQHTRESLAGYRGLSTVLDCRVTCQVPIIDNDSVNVGNDTSTLILNGTVAATTTTPRLDNSTLRFTSGDKPIWNAPIPFSCVGPVAGSTVAVSNASQLAPSQTQWRTTLCQLADGAIPLHFSGGLVNEFKPYITASNLSYHQYIASKSWGTAYLMMNLSSGWANQWRDQSDPGPAPTLHLQPGEINGEWRNYGVPGTDLDISLTLCYSSFMTADTLVNISSSKNRTEPQPRYDFFNRRMTFASIRQMLGQGRSASSADPGVLQLERPQTWVNISALPPIEPYMRDEANLAGPTGTGNAGNYSSFLWFTTSSSDQTVVPDYSFIWLFQEIVQTGGSVAFALQSLLTVLSSMAYYELLPQFDKVDDTSTSYYIQANVPQSYRGYIAVTVFVAVSVLLSVDMLIAFLRHTQYSMIGNKWQAVAQLSSSSSPEIQHILDTAKTKTDKEVKRELKEAHLQSTLVDLRPSADGTGPEITVHTKSMV